MSNSNVLSYVTHNTARRPIDVSYSGLSGHIKSSAEEITAVFGAPMEISADESDGKTTLEWHIRFSDGIVATIYDYKGDPIFHVGGFNKGSLDHVKAALGE